MTSLPQNNKNLQEGASKLLGLSKVETFRFKFSTFLLDLSMKIMPRKALATNLDLVNFLLAHKFDTFNISDKKEETKYVN
jgi:hypothetical protein